LRTPSYTAHLTDRYGHDWSVRGDYAGQIQLYGTNGEPLGTLGEHGDDTGDAIVTAFGNTATFSGHGQREFRDRRGRVVGYVFLGARPRFCLAQPVFGVRADAPGIRGFDSALGLQWSVHGQARVRMIRASDHHVLAEASGCSLPPSRPGVESRPGSSGSPEVTIVCQGRTSVSRGYGSRKITNRSGAVVLILQVSPR
jgi:hypothetical protein